MANKKILERTRSRLTEDADDIELGFLEETPAWRLQSYLFPCKMGGRPAWLSLNPLPSPTDLACPRCARPCIFLLQLFAPVNESKACFHRTVFVFVCRTPTCYVANSAAPVVVLRSQLARDNDFYSSEPPDEDSDDGGGGGAADHPDPGKVNPLCVVCGCLGDKKCSRCTKAYYCSREHQSLDWKYHKKVCKSLSSSGADGQGPPTTAASTVRDSAASASLLFPEREIVIEPENYEEEANKMSFDKTEQECWAEYEAFLQSSQGESILKERGIEKDLLAMARDEDKVFANFRHRIKHEPEQVIRYHRGGRPLWVSRQGIPRPEDIPACPSCGKPRQFEFQVLPQMLRHMDCDPTPATGGGLRDALLDPSIDWGTLAVYTCRDSCNIGNTYVKEFVWKQDYADTKETSPATETSASVKKAVVDFNVNNLVKEEEDLVAAAAATPTDGLTPTEEQN